MRFGFSPPLFDSVSSIFLGSVLRPNWPVDMLTHADVPSLVLHLWLRVFQSFSVIFEYV